MTLVECVDELNAQAVSSDTMEALKRVETIIEAYLRSAGGMDVLEARTRLTDAFGNQASATELSEVIIGRIALLGISQRT